MTDTTEAGPRVGRPAPAPPTSPHQRPGKSARRTRPWRPAPYVMIAPSVGLIAGLLLWPLGQVVTMSFQDFGLRQLRGVPADWVGFGNYSKILGDPFFWQVLRNTVLFAAVAVTLTMVIGTLVGLLLNRLGKRMSAVVGTGVLLAWATPAITAAIVFRWLFHDTYGIANNLLNLLPGWLLNLLFGRDDLTCFSWLISPFSTFALLTIIVVWQSFPFVAVSVLAGLRSVPGDLYEAAKVDGARPARMFWSITVPMLRPVFGILIVLSTIWDFKVFTQLYILTGTSSRNTYLLAVYGYAEAFSSPPKFSSGAAIAVVFTLILLIITIGYVRNMLREDRS